MTRQTIVEAVQQAKSGNISEFSKVVRILTLAVRRRYGVDFHSAEDIAQNALISLYKHLDCLEEHPNKLYRLIQQTIDNKYIDFIRYRTRRLRLFSLKSDIHENRISDNKANMSQDEGIIQDIMDNLSSQDRTILYSYYIDNYKLKEVAVSLDMTYSQVNQRIFNLRHQIKAEFKKRNTKLLVT